MHDAVYDGAHRTDTFWEQRSLQLEHYLRITRSLSLTFSLLDAFSYPPSLRDISAQAHFNHTFFSTRLLDFSFRKKLSDP